MLENTKKSIKILAFLNKMKIHILGPSGSGTSTLGEKVSIKYNFPWFDSDNFFWEKTEPPFLRKRTREKREKLLKREFNKNNSWILSGSVIGWGDFIKDKLDLVIYLYIEPNVRIQRLIDRERVIYGNRIDPGNDMYQIHIDFIEWARRYETDNMNMRSRKSDNEWMKDLKCKIIKIEEEMTLQKEMEIVSKEVELFL